MAQSPTARLKLSTGRTARISYDLSLEEFDADDTNADIPGTPRSLESLSRMGVDMEEILMKRVSDFKGPGKDPQYAEMELEAYDRLRRDTIDFLRETRMVIIQEQMADARGDDLAMREAEAKRKKQEMMERETKRMEFMAQRQEKQLEQRMQFEMLQAQIQAANLAKVAKQEAKAQIREEERKRKQDEYQEERGRRAAERSAKEEMDNIQKEREQHMKAMVLAEKEVQRAELAAQKRDRQNAEMAVKQEKQARKVAAAKELQRRQMAETTDKMEKKFELTELRREQFEEERMENAVRRQEFAEKKREEIVQVKIKVNAKESARKNELLKRQRAAENRLTQRIEMQKRLDREQKLHDQDKERQRRMVRTQAEEQYAQEIEQMRARSEESDFTVEKSKELKKIETSKKIMSNSLKRQMKMDKVERARRSTEYKRQQMEDKINQDMVRQNQIAAFKEQVNTERKEMQRLALLKQVAMEKKVSEVKKQMAKKQAKGEFEPSEPGSPGDQELPALSPALKPKPVKRAVSVEPSAERPNNTLAPIQRPSSSQSNPGGKPTKSAVAAPAHMRGEHDALMAEDQVQAMWREQNEKLLRLLEEEEIREAEREQQLAAVVHQMIEKQRLERQFESERTQARERIVRMTQQHERMLLNEMQSLGLLGKDGLGQSMILA